MAETDKPDRGKIPELSDDDLAKLSRVTEKDAERAAEWWGKVAPEPYRGLLGTEKREDK